MTHYSVTTVECGEGQGIYFTASANLIDSTGWFRFSYTRLILWRFGVLRVLYVSVPASKDQSRPCEDYARLGSEDRSRFGPYFVSSATWDSAHG